MRILFISDYFYPHWTGIARSVLKTAVRLSKKGYICSVLTVKHEKRLLSFEEYKGIRIYRASPVATISRLRYSIAIIFTFMKIARKYDLIFLNCPCANVLILTILTRAFGKKIILFLHGDLILPKGSMNWLIERIFDFSMFTSGFFADAVSTYTNDYAGHSRILRRFLHSFRPLLLPVYPLTQRYDDVVDSWMKRIKQKSQALYLIGFAGRFVEEKGFDILLKSMQIVTRVLRCHFLYAGATDIFYEKFYEKNKGLYRNNRTYFTHIGLLKSEEEMNAFYRNLDLFIVPSRSDCFPNTQVEAMYWGVPVVVTDIPGARFLVAESGFGRIAQPQNPVSLADRIISALREKEMIKRNASHALKLIREQVFFAQFEKLLQEIKLTC